MATPAPTLITYAEFLAVAQEMDVRSMTFLAAGEPIKTEDPDEAATYRQQLDRLWSGGVLTRARESREVIGGNVWFVFDARVLPTAMVYVADCAKERLQLSRDPIPQG